MDNFDTEKFESFLVELLDKDKERSKALENDQIDLADVDPFSALIECATLNLSLPEWVEYSEIRRKRQKALQNNIGKLHEIAISCFDGWELSASTADVENKELKVIAEIKNKHNTMNSSSALATYRKLEQLVDGSYEGYKSYVVQIIPKKSQAPYARPFVPSDSSKKNAKQSPERDDICVIDGESFYAMVSGGNTNAIQEVFEIMQALLTKHLGALKESDHANLSYASTIRAIRPSLRS